MRGYDGRVDGDFDLRSGIRCIDCIDLFIQIDPELRQRRRGRQRRPVTLVERTVLHSDRNHWYWIPYIRYTVVTCPVYRFLWRLTYGRIHSRIFTTEKPFGWTTVRRWTNQLVPHTYFYSVCVCVEWWFSCRCWFDILFLQTDPLHIYVKETFTRSMNNHSTR